MGFPKKYDKKTVTLLPLPYLVLPFKYESGNIEAENDHHTSSLYLSFIPSGALDAMFLGDFTTSSKLDIGFHSKTLAREWYAI
jgi:hypothetical protein